MVCLPILKSISAGRWEPASYIVHCHKVATEDVQIWMTLMVSVVATVLGLWLHRIQEAAVSDNPFDVLGVDSTASPSEIHDAYRSRLARHRVHWD